MSWAGIEGHDRIVEQFRRAIRSGRLANSFLFVGPPGVGKARFARKTAQALLCECHREEEFLPCGTCPACRQVEADSHPDLQVLTKPKDRSFIPVEALIGDREHRMREGLCHRIGLKPFRGGRKVAIIDDADYLNQEGANCLLKTLEEPPPRSVLILVGTSEQRQLPTIRSRCQIVRFGPLSADTVARVLVAEHLIEDPAQAARLARLAGGSVRHALEMADEAAAEFRESLLEELSQAGWDPIGLARLVSEFVEAAGKEAPPRRDRLRQVIGFAADFYRELMRRLCGREPGADETLDAAVGTAAQRWPGDAETAADCLERCLDADAHVLANANQATLIECWLDDLAAITRRASG